MLLKKFVSAILSCRDMAFGKTLEQSKITADKNVLNGALSKQ